MPLNTAQLRVAWAPACHANAHSMRAAYEALDRVLRAFVYVLYQDQCGAANCRKITNGTGYSLHSYFGDGVYTFWNGVKATMAVAVDLNWRLNPYGSRLVTNMPPAMRAAIKAIRTNSGKQVWGWGGDYKGNKDAMHWELVCSPADLATGIRGFSPTVPSVTPEEARKVLNAPIVGPPVKSPTGVGWWYVAEDGGVFPVDGAAGYGSMGGQPLNAKVVGLAPTSTGHGYWLLSADGGVFPFGDAIGWGSFAAQPHNAPFVGIFPSGAGFVAVGADGGLFPLGPVGPVPTPLPKALGS